ncbi:hypothetical protein L873DRAFT_633970 [Choiromyces venosus 120613-1]|uniref:Uncharacterized protein n=1 Tax=Choiromyces venosus 120613-1 TaxID=1336337 RepID=A0A3N4JTB3_9PEZI|nr:hypothetical protein L873DRAFT_633970 [Choiromyces venosus 120613-1]
MIQSLKNSILCYINFRNLACYLIPIIISLDIFFLQGCIEPQVMSSHKVTIVSHKVVLSRKVVLSCQALFRVPPVVSLRTFGGCGCQPQPWHDYSRRTT